MYSKVFNSGCTMKPKGSLSDNPFFLLTSMDNWMWKISNIRFSRCKSRRL